MKQEIRIIMADDHPAFRRGLRNILEAESGFRIIGEAPDGDAALGLIRTQKPHVAILDVDMPKLSGLDVAACVQREKIPVALLILTMYVEASIFERAMDLGVTGYLVKDTADDDIIIAVNEVSSGRYFISPRLLSNTVMHRKNSPPLDIALNLGQLTLTERYVLRLIAQSRSTKEIGETMTISPRTVERHRYKISQKLNLSGNYNLLRFALKHRELLEADTAG